MKRAEAGLRKLTSAVHINNNTLFIVRLSGLLSVFGLLLSATAWSSGSMNNNQQVPMEMLTKDGDFAVAAADICYPPQVMDRITPSHHATGDFNGDSLPDLALILPDGNKWKLIVFLLNTSGTCIPREITAFPEADNRWKSMSSEKVRIYTIFETGQSAERLGLVIDGMPGRMEYYWNKKTGNFGAMRIHNHTSDNVTPTGEVTLHALDIDAMKQQMALLKSTSCFNMDPKLNDSRDVADLCFARDRGTMIFYSLAPVNGAKAVSFGKSVPTDDDCRFQQDAMSNGTMPELEPGIHFCVITNEDNFAHVWILAIDPNQELLTLGFDIWAGKH